jgi:hypothetical protein
MFVTVIFAVAESVVMTTSHGWRRTHMSRGHRVDPSLSFGSGAPEPQESRSCRDDASLLAEGASLYREGLHSIPEDRVNWLLGERFREFDITGEESVDLASRLLEALFEKERVLSIHAVSFLTDTLLEAGHAKRALEVVRRSQALSAGGLFLCVKEAELLARGGTLKPRLGSSTTHAEGGMLMRTRRLCGRRSIGTCLSLCP